MTSPRLTAWREQLDRLLLALAVLFLATTVLIVIANVASRYVWQFSLPWSAELARFSIVWSALLASAVLVRRRQHLAVDLLGPRLSERGKRLVDVVIGVGSMVFFLAVAVSGAILVWRTSGQVASSIEWLPMPVVYSIVPLSAGLMWLAACLNLLEDLAPPSRTLGAPGTVDPTGDSDGGGPA